MELPTSLNIVMKNSMNYFMNEGQNLPENIRKEILEVLSPGTSPVDFVVKVAKALYSISNKLDKKGLEIAAQNANLASINNWHGMREKGSQMVKNFLNEEPYELNEVLDKRKDE